MRISCTDLKAATKSTDLRFNTYIRTLRNSSQVVGRKINREYKMNIWETLSMNIKNTAS